MDYVDPEENDESSVEAPIKKKKGRPQIPEKWTRVVNVDSSALDSLRTFEIKTDLLLAAGLPIQAPRRSRD